MKCPKCGNEMTVHHNRSFPESYGIPWCGKCGHEEKLKDGEKDEK